jgi:hypothetical protein
MRPMSVPDLEARLSWRKRPEMSLEEKCRGYAKAEARSVKAQNLADSATCGAHGDRRRSVKNASKRLQAPSDWRRPHCWRVVVDDRL